jgi:hypothetical protein
VEAETLLKVAHGLGGAALIVIGAVTLTAPKRRVGSRHIRWGEVYFWLLTITLGMGMAIGLEGSELTVFEVVTPPTFLLGLVGYATAKRRGRILGLPWVYVHVPAQGGSYIGVVTATSFQTIGNLLGDSAAVTVTLFALPTVVGTALIGRAVAARARMREPAPGI